MNERVKYASALVIAIAAVSVVAFGRLETPANGKAARSLVAQPTVPGNASPPPTGDLSRLGAEVASLQAQLAAVQSGLAQRAAAEAEARSEEPSRDPAVAPTPEESRAESEAQWQVHMAEVAADFAEEPVQKAWADEKQEFVEAQLQNQATLNGAAGRVECRSRSCRVAFTGNSTDLNKDLPLFVHSLGDTLPSAQAERIDEPDGRVTMVLYVSDNQEQPGERAPGGPN
ncbi:MAG TPA: hypothetical protein VMG12_39620 [Polyangiaceae bacterium]|nr:hypothetical protein [Polyangiaceae bacterium]